MIVKYATMLMTPQNEKNTLKNTLLRLEHETETIICWFESNYMKLNTDKYKYEHI